MNFRTFATSLPDGLKVNDEVVRALCSGFFEGEIVNSRISLRSTRKGFEENDALVDFASIVEKWFEQSGAGYFEALYDEDEGERYQTLGRASLRVFEGLKGLPEFASVTKTFDAFLRGSIGTGHIDRPGKVDDDRTISVHPGPSGNPTTPSAKGGARGGSGQPESDKPAHRPLVVAGPKGVRRKIVKSDSLGLKLAHEPMPGSDRLFELDLKTGTLVLNIRHPYWVEAENHGVKSLMRFQELLMVAALVLEDAPPESRRVVEAFLVDTFIRPYSLVLSRGDKLSGRVPTRKSTVPKESVRTVKASTRAKTSY
jgi:hypothetical protein